MQTAQHFFQPVIQAAAHRFAAVNQPLIEDLNQPFDCRTSVQADHIQVDAVASFQIRGREQVSHHLLKIDPVTARHNHQPGRIFVIRLIAQIFHHRQLFRPHLCSYLLQHFRTGNLVRQCGDHRITVLSCPHGAHTHRATAGFIDLTDIFRSGDDFRFCRIIRTGDKRHHLFERQRRLVDQRQQCTGHFTGIMRRNIRRHTDRNPGGAVEQNVRQTRR